MWMLLAGCSHSSYLDYRLWRCNWFLLLSMGLLLVVMPLLVPFSPKMPTVGLDPSWAFALNEAVAQGLSFGKQVVFTLGPYASIYTKTYHPATDVLMIGGSFYLALSYCLVLAVLMRQTRWFWSIGYVFCLLGMMYSKDTVLFSYPLLVGLLSYQCLKKENDGYQSFLIALAFAPFGLLVLIKGSFFILALAVMSWSASYFINNKQSQLGLIAVGAGIGGLLAFWLVAGQVLSDLPYYLIHSWLMAASFTQAMAYSGSPVEVFAYLIASLIVLLSIWSMHRQASSLRYFLLGLYVVFLFVSFKTGFTRHVGHAFIASTSILLAAFSLPFCCQSKWLMSVMASSLLASLSINMQHTRISLLNNMYSTYKSAWYGLQQRISNEHWLSDNYQVSLQFIREQAALPELKGSVDVYSYGQSEVIASGLQWTPRPIFQSYSVFNEYFANLNKHHLLEANKPDNLIFSVQPIDNRVPSLEDGASWPVILRDYEPILMRKNTLVLKKRAVPHVLRMHSLPEKQYRLGEWVTLSKQDPLLFVSLDLKQRWVGLIIQTLFKPEPLQLSVRLRDGSVQSYRLIAAMAKSGFLLSPFIENTEEFVALYNLDKMPLQNKKVDAFMVTVAQKYAWQWESDYTVKGGDEILCE